MLAAAATTRAVREAEDRRWTLAPLNMWSEPGETGRLVGLLDPLTIVLVTGHSDCGREDIVVEGRSCRVRVATPRDTKHVASWFDKLS